MQQGEERKERWPESAAAEWARGGGYRMGRGVRRARGETAHSVGGLNGGARLYMTRTCGGQPSWTARRPPSVRAREWDPVRRDALRVSAADWLSRARAGPDHRDACCVLRAGGRGRIRKRKPRPLQNCLVRQQSQLLPPKCEAP